MPSFRFPLVACLLVASANVVTFDTRLVGADVDTDLFILVAHEQSLGGRSLDKGLSSLDQERAEITSRGLVVSKCMGCSAMDQLLVHHHVSEDDLPVALLFPRSRDDTKAGIFRVSLKGVSDPQLVMTNFVKSFDSGDLKPWVRSLPVPTAAAQRGLVRIVVGDTYEDEVINADKHVLLLIHGDVDAASTHLQSVLEQIGQNLNTKSPLMVASFNHKANDFPASASLPVPSMPQLFLLRQDDGGDPDRFPLDSTPKPAAEEVISWLGQMLPENMYGLDTFFAKVTKGIRASNTSETHLERKAEI